ncbi:transcription/translation regulatory transformer protein RfaH [Parahaliea sp. F7430]|uniref:Transcription/translation regulatory transformer protein RfaH n=1 Tax=Sediminihaliea albiluteola TaxID=2758564 RepID=A0A7W2TUW1_9GAMM|nr:transcription/translation regulatory transformer protein RfaH [Sediminihaliea albiluteola]MBA6412303.1 transcription/translation regulatory transformer protein RfaH [Sediminihaliea albiluteola]
MTWLVVYTKPQKEQVAEHQLSNQGFNTLLPMITQRKRVRGKWQDVRGALFPRYLFIEVALGTQSIASVRSTIGVVDVLRFGQQPATVPDTVINYLRQQQAALEAGSEANAWPHKPGDRVEIFDGPFAGLQGVYKMAKNQDRAALLIELLGRQNEVVIEQQFIGQAV